MKGLTKAAAATVLLATSGVTTSLWRSRVSQGGSEPPYGMVKTGGFLGTSGKAAKSDLKLSWYDWGTLQKTVSIKRRERETVNATWYEQVQEMAASYFPVDVRCVVGNGDEVSKLYIAGIYPSGEACIEEWKFTQKILSVGGYVPINQRPLPIVKRTELFRGTQYGRIASLERDPDGRFLLFLTRENPRVYRLALPSHAITLELSQAQQAYLANGKQLVARHHVIAGRQFHVIQDSRWEADLSVPRSTVILHDANNDGTFESSETITWATWNQRGYDDPGAWSIF